MNPPTVIQVTRGPIPLKSPSGRMCDASWFNILGPCWAVLGHAGPCWAIGQLQAVLEHLLLQKWCSGLGTVPPYFLTASTRKGGGGKERAIIKEVQSSSQAHYFGIALCETEESEYVLGTIFVGTPAPRFFDPPIFCVFLNLGSLGNSENRTPSSTFSSMIRVLATSKGVVTPPAMPPATDPHAAPGPNPGDGHG